MHQTTLERIEQELKKIKRQLQCGTQFFDTVEEFPAVGVPCAIYVDKSTGAFYVYDTETATYISADTGVTPELSGAGTAGQVAYWTGATTLSGESNLFYDAANDRLGVGVSTSLTARAHIRGSGTTSATTALLVQNSTPTEVFTIKDNGWIGVGASNISLYPYSSIGTPNLFGKGMAIAHNFSGVAGTGISVVNAQEATRTATSGESILIRMVEGFAPTSGTGTFISTAITGNINQTGGANGITRGLYVNPTLTSAADWRSVEFSNNTGWGIYGAGTANNYLGGKLGIGTTSLTYQNFSINRTITGATISTSYEISGNVQSDVTNIASGYSSAIGTQNALFTLNSLRHVFVQQGTFGASSIVTSQSGFHVNSSLTGATNNYGFYGGLSSGTGRWNLYMDGTAANYLAGNTSIGTTTESARLLVRGSGTTSATTALLVQNSTPTELFKVTDDGVVLLNFLSRLNSTLQLYGQSGAVTGILLRSISSSETATSGTRLHVRVNETFAPTSGTCVLNTLQVDSTINQTGGANGITRGLYVNPTLTSAATWRSIEWSNNTGWGLYGAGSATNYLEGALTIGTSNISGSAVLQVNSTTKGFLPPRLTTAQRDLIASPAAGLVIFNTTTTKLECYDGAAWQAAW